MGTTSPAKDRIAGIVLAGGTGSRLFPATRVVNKHLLPVYDRPAIAFSLDVMRECGVDTLVLVCNAADEEVYRSIPAWLGYSDIEIRTVVQNEPNGIAGAISCARDHLESEGYRRIVVALGDTLYVSSSAWAGNILTQADEAGCGAAVAVIEHPDPRDFGVVESAAGGAVVRVNEKSDVRHRSQVCTGLYSFDESMWKRLESIVPSQRGELEITSLLESYIDDGGLTAVVVPEEAGWFDVGTPDRLVDAAVARRRQLV
ncbi:MULTISPECIES: sugar phosphate nucleotidyltransferase [Streptomyces]|uniref:Glucose-1-phosphate thymidylyltransferase n=1 Tax=Streptomyces sindenensis TaxID=67363 RepID=A0ABW6EJ04_9ACTN|nr:MULTISPECIES: sugar phosphate nucleotidyltransferase [Streptomyces]WGP11071.1 sugar phosphate nucleotidyltransferase [Streptomyces sp. SH5]GGP48710.1 glucose-1-phosphate thymidylyltransferase [Streptomyces sindenensis]